MALGISNTQIVIFEHYLPLKGLGFLREMMDTKSRTRNVQDGPGMSCHIWKPYRTIGVRSTGLRSRDGRN